VLLLLYLISRSRDDRDLEQRLRCPLRELAAPTAPEPLAGPMPSPWWTSSALYSATPRGLRRLEAAYIARKRCWWRRPFFRASAAARSPGFVMCRGRLSSLWAFGSGWTWVIPPVAMRMLPTNRSHSGLLRSPPASVKAPWGLEPPVGLFVDTVLTFRRVLKRPQATAPTQRWLEPGGVHRICRLPGLEKRARPTKTAWRAAGADRLLPS